VPIDLQGRAITANPVHHAVDAVSYFVHKGSAGFLFTGDMSTTPSLWELMKTESALSKIIVDCSFTNADAELSRLSGHYCPQSLLEDIQAMPMAAQFLIYHLKPGQEDMIMQELKAGANGRSFEALKCGDQFVFDENA
jgi:3',5'-cyclic-nucleotide phosphodiesterase